MIFKSLILLFLVVLNEAQYFPYNSCPSLRLENGRVRTTRQRERYKMVKFLCAARYMLVGNRYATCRNGKWDVPMPVCVRWGCESFSVDNAVHIREHNGAWVLTLCMPKYSLVGSSALYCDGYHWNGTIPTCVSATSSPDLSCDFEEPGLCGWIQDELHDFDWKRINTKTPSSFMDTGPSYDHTLGDGGKGYFMYIESTSRHENSTARLLSPVYSSSLALQGCFTFFFHMYGDGTGGLRIYQKPDSVQLEDLLTLSDSAKDQYLLWEKWGDQGNYWYSAAPDLKDFKDNFQIVIEGVRGRSYTSDIAVDDVALQHGENCSKFLLENTTPLPTGWEWSCENRCGLSPEKAPSDAKCDCHLDCYKTGHCCVDYAELCIFSRATSSDDDYGNYSTVADEQPQTQKLVGEITTTTITTPQPTTTMTTTVKPTTTTTRKPTTETTPPTKPPTTRVTIKPNVTVVTKTTQRWTTESTSKIIHTEPPTTITLSTQKTTKKPASTKPTVKPTKIATLKTTIQYGTVTPKDKNDDGVSGKETVDAKKSEKESDLQEIGEKTVEKKSSSVKTAVITIVFLALFAGLVYLALVSRSARGREALAWLRGHGSSDTSEVRYLNSNDDDL